MSRTLHDKIKRILETEDTSISSQILYARQCDQIDNTLRGDNNREALLLGKLAGVAHYATGQAPGPSVLVSDIRAILSEVYTEGD